VLWRSRLREGMVLPPPPPVEVTQAPLPVARPPRRASTRSAPEPTRDAGDSSACSASIAERCLGGDLWLVDSCGRAEEKVEECGEGGCRDDECDVPLRQSCDEPPEGRCDGEVVRLCSLGKPLAIDCAAKGMRCGQGDEGAECLTPIPLDEQCDGPDRCDHDTLLRCVGGRRARVDCAALRGRCLQLASLSAPTCVVVMPTVVATQGCGPCGCSVPARRGESCDNRDEDGDGLVDQGVDCGPVRVRAFILAGSGGQTNHAREDVEAELARANEEFARAPASAGLSFTLVDVTTVSDSALLSLDNDEVQALASDPRIHPPDDQFYVPLVFTDTLVAGGETPKPGLSTLPNGMCGGMKEGRGPEVGMIAVAKARYPTTVVHELGHFLGLCHTHDQQEATPFRAYSDGNGKLQSCSPSCRGEGDGICDTPFDPGPELCTYDERCVTACRVDAAPDTRNLMSYYATCRERFSDEQMALMQHTLALRRGWHRCVGASCPCAYGEQDCPADMTCRPVLLVSGEQTTRCGFDGPRGAAADCQSAADCGQGTLCMTEQQTQKQRCVRPCSASSEGCTCVNASPSLTICAEDLLARS
jgi:hypothetical protein